ncbi:MAG: hypothetical protein EOO01_15670 [Chitinophagaceae bacterium]|nr:MAG: hypothetical protein EOO01_15670 [Chitinophagaceae bacterium]
MKANFKISQGNLVEAVKAAAKIAANESVIHSKFVRAEWNTEPADFYSSHGFIEQQYNELEAIFDEVVKRIRKLKHCSPHTFEQVPDAAQSAAHLHGADDPMSNVKASPANYRLILMRHKFLNPILSAHSS